MPGLLWYADWRHPMSRDTEVTIFRQMNCLKHRLAKKTNPKQAAKLRAIVDVLGRRVWRLGEGLALRQSCRSGLDPADCLSAAGLAITEAIRRFDYAGTVRFATYAGWRVRYRCAGLRRTTAAPLIDVAETEVMHDDEAPAKVAAALSPLTATEASVVKMRAGLNGYAPGYSWSEIAEKLALCDGAYAHRVYARALAKMRRSSAPPRPRSGPPSCS